MPSTYSNIKIQLMATGENNTTWGNVTNINLGTALEEAIVGSADVTFASGNVTLTLTDTNASQTARHVRLRCTGVTGGSTRDLIVPAIEKPYLVQNDCLNSIVVKNATGTGVTVPAGKTMWVYNDGTNVVDAVNHLSSLTLGTALPVGQGGTGASTFTANGIIYGNTTSALLATAAGTTGQVLVGNTGGAPSWATLTGIGVTSFSGGTTGLTPASPTTGAITLAGTLGVANGGTGNTTFLSNYLLKGNGTSAVTSSIVYDNGTNVGIATSSPTERLTVAGNTKIGEGVASNTSKLMVNTLSGVAAGIQLIQDANESWIIQNPASTNVLTFSASGSERMRITSAGNVGVGTAFPSTVYRQTINGDGSSILGGLSLRNNGTETLVIGNITATNDVDSEIWNPRNGFLRFATNNTERMRIDGSGNVGIGTTSPASFGKFAVTGTLGTVSVNDQGIALVMSRAGDNYIAAPSGNLNYSAGTHIWTNSAQTTEYMRIDSGGNVGIGTSSPGAKLDVYDAVNGYIRVGGGTGTNQGAGFFVKNASNNNTLAAFGDRARIFGGTPDQLASIYTQAVPLTFDVNSAERMRITGAGNVGIGTTTPAVPLDVRGSVAIGGPSSSYLIANYNSEILAGVDAGGYYYASGFGAASNIPITMGDRASYIAFKTSPSTAAGFERMRITGTGDVGIGTGTPSNRLHVNSGASTTSAMIESMGTSAFVGLKNSGATAFIGSDSTGAFLVQTPGSGFSTKMFVGSTGDVGIGTVSPGNKLDVVGGQINTVADDAYAIALNATTGNIRILPYASTYSGSALIAYNAGYTGLGPFSIDASRTQFFTNSAERMRITSAGNLGVGTTTPQNKVSVVDFNAYIGITNSSPGTVATPAWSGIKFYGFAENTSGHNASIESGNSASNDLAGILRFLTAPPAGTPVERMRIDGVGNVGIGTATPQSKLHVNDAGSPATYVTAGNNAGGTQLGVDTAGTSVLSAFAVNALRFGHSSSTTFVENMRLTAAGNLGIGTSAPALPLVVSNAGTTGIEFSPSGGIGGGTYIQSYNRNTATYTPNTNYAASQTWYVGATRAMDLDSSGNFLVGTTSATYANSGRGLIEVNGSSEALYGLKIGGVARGYLFHNNLALILSNDQTGGPLVFLTEGTEKARIDSSGNLLVGTTSANGSMANTATTNSGVFNTLSGTVSAASGAATTIATANQNYASATYIVSCSVSSGAPNFYSAVAIVSADNNVLRITNLQTATNMTISISGTNIQATQTSGGTTTIIYSLIRIG